MLADVGSLAGAEEIGRAAMTNRGKGDDRRDAVVGGEHWRWASAAVKIVAGNNDTHSSTVEVIIKKILRLLG
jgi:hypothetical protein